MKLLKLLPLSLTFFFFFCSSSGELEFKNSRDRFEIAKVFVKEASYTKAIENLKIIEYEKGVEYADSVQYLLAECYFKTEQFILSGAEYQGIVRYTPSSPLVAEARYMVGVCYSKIAPSSYLDQNYTLKAIGELQAFIEYFPTHDRARDAERLIIELRNKLAEKDYNTAVLYTKMSKYRSAIVYYNTVLEKFHDSSFADLAQLGIIEAYILQEKKELAIKEIDKFLIKYPNSKKKEEVLRLKQSI